jgi:hypothetical protein
MWNEPNLGYSWHPEPDPVNYALLAISVGKALKDKYPNEMYQGPASSGYNTTYMEIIFQMGVLEYFDAVSVHP